MQVVANYGTKDVRINRNILGWNIGKDSPTEARVKGQKLGIHFQRFSEVGAREDPLKRMYSYRSSAKKLRFLDVPISKVYLHFMDEQLMNVVLYPTKNSDIHVLKKSIEKLYSRKMEVLLGEP